MRPLTRDDAAWFRTATITIYGLGLMGASLAMALRNAGMGNLIQAIDEDPRAIEKGLAQQVIDAGTTKPDELLPRSDLVILAVPVGAICHILETMGKNMPPGTIVTDMGSTKIEIVRRMNRLPRHISAIGGHPMCGREINGIAAARADLFQGKRYFLTPTERTTPKILAVMQFLISRIGATPVITDPQTHDAMTALTSHAPYLLSVALNSAVTEKSGSPTASPVPFISSGFLDTTRIAGSDVSMMLDILSTNKTNVLKAVDKVLENLVQLRRWLELEQMMELKDFLSTQRENRRGREASIPRQPE
ncbi:MAG: prephenate dehydrogenase [Candidatus Marinimicrobia bacterium]|nr:prephenate dehydrogenase [Candidatus Neomarinimicrobiota bacterium]MCF7840863.1 prephenate dehydrogenase [Candidatus Neomarinimicrobiota bacterium]MCF7902810.1 prephenate dehydrogenase [Candidatus Neomarinimicrobiota bacterium]